MNTEKELPPLTPEQALQVESVTIGETIHYGHLAEVLFEREQRLRFGNEENYVFAFLEASA